MIKRQACLSDRLDLIDLRVGRDGRATIDLPLAIGGETEVISIDAMTARRMHAVLSEALPALGPEPTQERTNTGRQSLPVRREEEPAPTAARWDGVTSGFVDWPTRR